jgi:hypothetical protein
VYLVKPYLFFRVMNKSVGFLNDLANKLDKNVSSYFSTEDLDRLARLTGFNERIGRGKLTGSMFLDLIVFNAEKLNEQTLESSCAFLSERYTVLMKRQSLHERFNSSAVFFLSKVLENLLRQRFSQDSFIEEFKIYKRILIKDSTCFQVPADLHDKYPGSGGKDTGSAVRIQFEYDILSGSIIQLRIDAFNHQDALNATESIDLVNPGDLVLRDLGYMHKKVLQKIDIDQEAAYVARLDSRIDAYEMKEAGKYQRIDFSQLRAKMKQKNTPIIEKTVYLGADKLHRTRLIIALLPQEVEEMRLRKITIERKRNGSGEPSKELKVRSQLTLMITNETSAILPAEKVYTLYMVRWQIELVFKAWKSICGLSSFKMVKGDRVECYIYGRLILILLAWNIIWPIMGQVYRCYGKLISFYKTIKTITNRVRTLASIIIQKQGSLKDYLKNLYETIIKVNMLECKGKDLMFLKIITECISCGNTTNSNT